RGDRDARLILQNVITTGDAPARASAARQLHGFSWYVAGPIAQQALKDADSRVREGAVYALCDMRDINAYQLLVETLQNETDNVRAAAAWGLRDCQDAAAVPVLESVLKAIDPDVRVKGLEALGANQTSLAVPIVRHSLDDVDHDVQYAATLSWLELMAEACLLDLALEIERSSGLKRAAILRGLFHATNYLQMDIVKSSTADRVISAIESALLDPLPQTRLAAIWPLAWIRHPRAPAILQQAYDREQNSDVKAPLVQIAYNLMSPAGKSILETALQSSDDHVRETARAIAHEHQLSF
ncbi:MAG TPA: HEAT repeat domain-containing protein, partial [Anaerolineae bacterium]|nr:HEAT repeat domain-containing protein [Anaerolineae bacterium]